MIAEKDLVIYDETGIIAEVRAGLEYHTKALIFEGTAEDFYRRYPKFKK